MAFGIFSDGNMKKEVERLKALIKELESSRDEYKLMLDKAAHLASFPSANPNPIIEIGASSGNILYMNPASIKLFPDLMNKGLSHPILSGFNSILKAAGSDPDRKHYDEVGLGGILYGRISYFDESNRAIRMFLNDITGRKKAEEKLAGAIADSEARYRTIFESSKDAIMLLDEKGFFDCNESTLRVFGLSSKEEFIAKHPSQFSPPKQPDGVDSYPAAMKHIEKAFREGGDFFEWMHMRGDGSVFPANVLLSRFELKGRMVLQAVVRDVTDIKKHTERLARITDCFISLTTDPIENIRKFTSLFGEIVGASCALYNRIDQGLLCSVGQWNAPEGYNPVDKPNGHICHDVIKTAGEGILIVRDLQNSPYALTDPNVKKFGLKTYVGKAVKVWNEYIGSLCAVYSNDHIPSEEDKQVVSIVAAAIGVEEMRRKAEEAVIEDEKLLNETGEMAKVGGWEVDLAISRVTWTEEVYRIHGIDTRHKPSLKEAISYFAPESVPILERALREAAENGTSFDLELQLVTSSGKKIWTRAVGRAMYRGDKVVKLHGTFQDIDDRKRSEERMQEKMDELEKFNKLAVGREMKMIELKERIRELEEKLGEKGG